ncbi:MAG: PAS domain-containing protein, partial [Planctomycetales bacterium]
MAEQPFHTLTNPLITLHDARGRILHASPLRDYTSDELLQTAPWDWLDSEEDRERVQRAYQQVLFDRKPTTCRIKITLKDGSTAQYECRATPVDAGEVVAMVSS